MILLATCERTLEAFEEANEVLDPELVADLERVVERTRSELNALQSRAAELS